MRYGIIICAVLLLCTPALSDKTHDGLALPTQFELGRHTFIDFGPPTDFYELFIVRPNGKAASVNRIMLTPPADLCIAPAKLETASAMINQTPAALLSATNPCT